MSLGINPYTYGYLIFDKGIRTIQWGWQRVFSTNDADIIG